MLSLRPLFFRSLCTALALSPNTHFLFVSGLQYSFYLPSCTPHLYPHDSPPSLLLIQHIHNIIRTIHTKNASTRWYSHTLSYCTTQSILAFPTHLDLCSAFPFRSIPFFPLFVLSLPYLYTMLSALHSVVFHSSPLCSRFCHPSFDLCSLTLFHSHSPFSSLAICFRGIASIWNLGSAAFQKPRNESKLAHKECFFCVRSPTGYYCIPYLGMLPCFSFVPPQEHGASQRDCHQRKAAVWPARQTTRDQ
ncbi:hypothetical protein EDB87DRAFT_146174 [Lactarius vividus]|nr:hypothetical protein EDB87DRAFT_146174 [Lactarius vividus]